MKGAGPRIGGILIGLGLVAGLGWAQTPTEARLHPSSSTSGDSNESPVRKFVQEGIAIEFSMEHVLPAQRGSRQYQEGDLTTFRFAITDTTTETPLSGVFPAAWMDFRPEGDAPTDPKICKDKVEAFVGGSLLTPPELDLNTYYVLALNNDATVSVVDPLFGYGTTKLLSMLFLESPGEDWVLTPDQSTLFISMPKSGRVAVADTAGWKVTENLEVCPMPSRMALQPDSRFLWVGCNAPREGFEGSGVAVIDVQRPAVVKEIGTGRGPHEIAFSMDDRYAFVTNQADGTLSVIDIRKLEKIDDIEVGGLPVSLDFSTVGQAVYIVDQVSGTVLAVDAESLRQTGRLQLEPGLTQIRFEPKGRFGFILNSARDKLQIVDASTNRVIQSADMQKGPDQVSFSDELAYVRHRDSELVLMIPLDQVGREGAPLPVIDFPGGQTPFGKGSAPSLANSIVQAPGANAVLGSNPVDRVIYYYREGMAAPMGQFQNYGRQPRAVLAVDRSLKERRPGVYETTAALRQPGLYDVAFFLDSPRTIHCFPVRVDPNPALARERAKRKPVDIEPLVGRRTLPVGGREALVFRLTDPLTGEPKAALQDVTVLSFRAPGVDQKRQKAEDRGDGVYEVVFAPDHPGVYYVFLACPSLGLDFNKSPFVTLRVTGDAGPPSPDPGRDESHRSQGRRN